jgi:hypothetical protein
MIRIIFLLLPWSLAYAQDAGPPNIRGGIGGKIIKVTNLNNSGPGSLLAAINLQGPRIVVFEVGGTIDYNSSTIEIKEPFLTIAGQTAPSPGITLINASIIVKSHDVIIEHIRIRTGSSKRVKGEPDALNTNAAYNLIINHCSISWGIDENCSVSGPRFAGNNVADWRKNTSHNIRITNNIISEGLRNSIHSKGEHSKGTLVHDNATDVLIARNLYASNMDRNALFKGGTTAVFLNNFIYNPGKKAIKYALVKEEWEGREYQPGKLTVIGNVLQNGPDTQKMCLMEVSRTGPCRIYMEDNSAYDLQGKPICLYHGDERMLVSKRPIWFQELTVIPSHQLEKHIVKSVGARPWDRDLVDKRIVNELQNRNGKIIDSEAEVGGYPKMKNTRFRFLEKEWDMKTMQKKSSQ